MADDADFASEHLERQEADFQRRLREARATPSPKQRVRCLDCDTPIEPPNDGRCRDCQDDVDRIRFNRRI